jgi:hypothetical protein
MYFEYSEETRNGVAWRGMRAWLAQGVAWSQLAVVLVDDDGVETFFVTMFSNHRSRANPMAP